MFEALKAMWYSRLPTPTTFETPPHHHFSKTPKFKTPKGRRKAKNKAQRQARRLNRR